MDKPSKSKTSKKHAPLTEKTVREIVRDEIVKWNRGNEKKLSRN